MTRSIVLTRQAQQPGTVHGLAGYRFTVAVSDGSGIDDRIFRMLRTPIDSLGNTEDVFDGICRPAEMVDLPADAPDVNSQPPFFRTALLDLVFRSESEADAAWTAIKRQILALLEALDAMDRLGPDETVTITT